tara:strand:+ start:916 stop:1362 length:447 start_codon:yes stop_codon:yes gene_type:complete
MPKLLSLLSFILVFSFISQAQADSEYEQTLKKMFKLSGTEQSYQAAVQQMISLFKEQYTEVDPAIWDEFQKSFAKTSLNDLTEMLVPVYAKHLTKKDLEELIKFYESPIGKKFAKSTPLITQESMQVGQEWGRKIGQDFVKKMEEEGY